MRRTRKRTKRGFTDKLYLANFVAVQFVVIAIVLLTMFSGKLGITDMSALATIPACCYAELGVFSAAICWKNRAENLKKLENENSDILTYL